MGFLIKSAFWLSLVLLIIPLGGGQEDGERPAVGPIETFFAARAVIDDVSGLCGRRPEACEVGRSALSTIGMRAKEGARLAYGVLDEHFGENGEPIHTGSIQPQAATPQPAPIEGE